MASSNKVTVKDLITCVFCHVPFDDPRLMPCSHTYCYKCIKQMATTTEDQFECPLRDGCKVSKKNIDSLPLNRGIRDLVDLFGSTERSKLCSNCQLVAAEHGCDKCTNEKFCLECYQTVHTTHVMKKHKQMPLAEVSTELIPCLLHPKKILEYWCHTCVTVICIDCLLFKHKEHQYALLDDVAKEFEARVHTDLQSIESSLEYRIQRTQTMLNKIHTDSKANRVKVSEAMKTLRKSIDDHEKTMLQRILGIEKKQRKQFSDYRLLVKEELQNLNIQKKSFEMIFSTRNHAKLLQTKRRFDSYAETANNKLRSLSIPPKTAYALGGLDRIQVLKDTISQCGKYGEVAPYHNAELEKIIADSQTKRELDLKHKNLNDSDMKIVVGLIQTSTTLVKLYLEHNKIGEQGAQHIADTLQTNQTLTELYLGNNKLGRQGVQHIADALKLNQKLTKLYLRDNKLGEEEAQCIADALKTNQTLIALGLGNNKIGEQGAQYIADALKINRTLAELYLGNNKMGHQGIQHIIQVLKTNETITTLDLENNKMGQQGAQQMADALRMNGKLTLLAIENNQIGPEGILHIVDALKMNQKLSRLYIRDNQLGSQGAQHVAELLKINIAITVLGLGTNQIGQEGARHIAEALKINNTLTELYLRDNQIGPQGAQYIADALKTNKTLTVLYLENNDIKAEGAQYIIDALKSNQKLIDLRLANNGIEEDEKQRIKGTLTKNKIVAISW